jgi:hypothetical protein
MAILFFASSGLLCNSVVIGYSYKLREPGCWRNVIFSLECFDPAFRYHGAGMERRA